MICGGTGDEKVADPEVQAVVDSVKNDIVAKLGSEPEQLTATHYKTQVVAGKNYFVRVHIGQDKHIHVRIYKHFSGTVALHGVKHHDVGGVAASEELAYFDQNVN